MSSYLRHYWSLFGEFIEAFASIKYNNFPLPLLSNFYQYLSPDITKAMNQPQFQTILKHVITDDSQIQPLFDQFIQPIVKKEAPKSNGKILINGTYHRFQPSVFLENFHPHTTLLLSRGKPYLGIPIVTLSHYEPDVSNVIQASTEQYIDLFTKYADHPVFSEEHFQTRVLNDLPRIIKILAATEAMFQAVPVSCVVVGTTEDLTSRALALVGASYGVPSVCLQHGVIMGEEAFLPVFTTVQAVYGQYEMDWYVSKGTPQHQISIVGHPRYDMIYTEARNPIAGIDQLFKPNTSKLLMVTQPQTNKELFTAAVKLIVQIPNVEVLIKPHPWERKKGLIQEYQQLESEFPTVKVVPPEIVLYDLLPHMDIVVMENSTVGLEAMLFNKPVIVFRNPDSEKQYTYYDRMHPYIELSPEGLSELIQRAVSDHSVLDQLRSKTQQFTDHAYPLTLSAPKLVQLLSQLSGHPASSLNTFLKEGMLVKGIKHEVSKLENGKLRPFSSTSEFQQLGYRWDDVYQIDDRLLDQIPLVDPVHEGYSRSTDQLEAQQEPDFMEGYLLKASGPEIYLFKSGMRQLLAEGSLKQLENSNQTIYVIDDRILQRIPKGIILI